MRSRVYETERCPSVCLFVRPIRPLQYSVRRVCCCGPGEWEISLDCCSSGVRMRAVTRCQRTMVAEQTRSYSASPKCENSGIGNENVPNITINNAIKLFSKTAMSIRVTSNRNSFRVLFDKIASVCFIWKMYLYFSVGNGQPGEPALCQLYRHAVVPHETGGPSCSPEGRTSVAVRSRCGVPLSLLSPSGGTLCTGHTMTSSHARSAGWATHKRNGTAIDNGPTTGRFFLARPRATFGF